MAMLCCFLYELTVYDQLNRQNIFKAQLFKVVTTNISVYLIAIIYAYWIQTLVDFTVKSHKEYVTYIAKRRMADEEFQRTKNDYRYK